MLTPTPLRGTPRMLLAAVVWILLLLGLFAMHGASSHGTAAHPSSPTISVADLAASHDGHADHEGPAGSAGHLQDSEDDGGSPGHNVAELCLAILGALLPALVVFGALTQLRRPLFTMRQRPGSAPFPSWLRPPDPPCLIRLSILRC